jgi:hypothetical protein
MPKLSSFSDRIFLNNGVRYTLSTIYTLTPAANNVNEGSSLTFIVSGSNITNGTYYWTVSRPEDFAVSSGSFTITSNSGSFSVTPTADDSLEGSETFTASIRSGSTSGTILQTSSSVTINDTSTGTLVPSSTRAFTVAQGTNQGLFTTDGITWAEVTLPYYDIWLDSNYNPAAAGRACALAWGRAIYSTDFGQTWSSATGMGGGAGTVSALAPVTSTVWITMGANTTEYFRSTDNGQTWSSFNFGSTYNGRGVAGVGAGLAVIVTDSLTYYTTTDGSSFTPRTFPSNPGNHTGWRRIEYVNGLYIAMETNNHRYIMTSSDGTNWTVRDVTVGVNSGGTFRDISFGGAGTWLIVVDNTAVYFTSTDLITWTRRTLPSSRRWCGITWINNRWVAIVDGESDTGNIKATSIDGINWVESALASTNRRWTDLTEVR